MVHQPAPRRYLIYYLFCSFCLPNLFCFVSFVRVRWWGQLPTQFKLFLFVLSSFQRSNFFRFLELNGSLPHKQCDDFSWYSGVWNSQQIFSHRIFDSTDHWHVMAPLTFPRKSYWMARAVNSFALWYTNKTFDKHNAVFGFIFNDNKNTLSIVRQWQHTHTWLTSHNGIKPNAFAYIYRLCQPILHCIITSFVSFHRNCFRLSHFWKIH